MRTWLNIVVCVVCFYCSIYSFVASIFNWPVDGRFVWATSTIAFSLAGANVAKRQQDREAREALEAEHDLA